MKPTVKLSEYETMLKPRTKQRNTMNREVDFVSVETGAKTK
jgi:hypothetical protein